MSRDQVAFDHHAHDARVARRHLRDPQEIKIRAATSTVAKISQRYWLVRGVDKLDALTRILDAEETFDAALVFVRTKIATEELADKLAARGYAAAALNGDMTQGLRERVIEQLKKDPGSVKWGGGSRGSTEHIAAAMIAREVGVDPAKINYVAFRGGGEATAAILGGNVTIGGSGYSEFAEYIAAGKMRAVGVTSSARLKGVNVPTLKEQGINVDIGNWRGVYGAPGITAEQRKALIDALSKTFKHKAWQDAMEKNGWTPAWLAGDEFSNFVDSEFASLRATMAKSGMI